MLIAAVAGRALAVAARRAGYVPLVADLFGDEDMRNCAAMSARIPGDLESGLEESVLVASLSRLAADRVCEGLVCGAGFEDRSRILSRLAANWPLIGNSAETVARAKDPLGFSRRCAALGLPHPPVRVTRPPDPRGWLAKRIGGAGGAHVVAANQVPERPGEVYYQRKMPGRAVSALFLANGEDAQILGFSAQWSDAGRHAPARYGGAVRPAGISAGLKRELARGISGLARALGLLGLNSVDFLVNREEFWLIEVNPRPGATLDLFDDDAQPLFGLHVHACRGVLPARAPRYRGAAAAAIAYATRALRHMPELDWPDWSADRQSAGSSVAAGAPICTVLAKAGSAARARTLVDERIKIIRGMAQGERR